MTTLRDYMILIDGVKYLEITSEYRNQFKLKETMLNASSRNFNTIASKYSVFFFILKSRFLDK